MTSRARIRWASPALRRGLVRSATIRSISSTGSSVSQASSWRTWRSSVWMKCWYSSYGLVRSGSSQTRAPVVLPSLVPSAAVSSGQHRAWTVVPVLAPDQVDPRQDVAPLVRAADLELAAVMLVEPPVVVRLQAACTRTR